MPQIKMEVDRIDEKVNISKCSYLDTIDRKALDFDFEKICTKSLAKTNVYCCLVCGKYFQGRGRSSHAFSHSVSEFHHVYLNLESLKFYCLPDNYEIIDDSLNDILYYLKPTFDHEDIQRLDTYDKPISTLNGKSYYLGVVGLNNLKHNDYCNVIFQALSQVKPLRDFFLIDTNYLDHKRDDNYFFLWLRYGELVRKIWNPRNFKTHVSPHEMLQAVALISRKKFEITKQNDPILFLVWFLNALSSSKQQHTSQKQAVTTPANHDDINTSSRSKEQTKLSIIRDTFEGQILVKSRLILPNVGYVCEETPQIMLSDEETQSESGFLYLTLDMPTMPLFPKKDEKGKIVQPRVGVYDLLSKYNGIKKHEHNGSGGGGGGGQHNEASIRTYEIRKFPKYLILYYKRMTKNAFFIEKNTHIIDSPLTNLKMSLLSSQSNTMDSSSSNNNKNVAIPEYNLLANIIHDGEPQPGKGAYRAQVRHRGSGKWFELQDLYVTEISDLTRISISESYIQIWEQSSVRG